MCTKLKEDIYYFQTAAAQKVTRSNFAVEKKIHKDVILRTLAQSDQNLCRVWKSSILFPQSGFEGRVHSTLPWLNYMQKSTVSAGIYLGMVQRCCERPPKQRHLVLWSTQSAEGRPGKDQHDRVDTSAFLSPAWAFPGLGAAGHRKQ